jgi:hypothetical protein
MQSSNRVAAGHKDEGTTTEPPSRPYYGGDKDENRVLGGYKATLKSQFSFF